MTRTTLRYRSDDFLSCFFVAMSISPGKHLFTEEGR